MKKEKGVQRDKDVFRRFLLFIVEENPRGGLADMNRDFNLLEAAMLIAKAACLTNRTFSIVTNERSFGVTRINNGGN